MSGINFLEFLEGYGTKKLYGFLLEVTHRCNLDCSHCWIKNDSTQYEMSTEEVFTVLKKAKDTGFFNIVITGGDPFKRNDIFEILDKAYEFGFGIRVFTNGYLLGKKEINKLGKYDKLKLDISIYENSVKNSEGSIFDVINKCVENGLFVETSILWNRFNYKNRDMFYTWRDKTGILLRENYVHFPKINGDRSPLELNINSKQIKELMRKSKLSNKGITCDTLICGDSNCLLVVSPSGDIYPCVHFRIKLGNAISDDIIESFNSGGNICKYREEVVFKQVTPCSKCDSLEYCTLFCLGFSLDKELPKIVPNPIVCNYAKINKESREKIDE